MNKGVVGALLLAGWMAFSGAPRQETSERPPWRTAGGYGGAHPAEPADRRLDFRLHQGMWSPRLRPDSTLRPWTELSPKQMERIRHSARQLIG